MTQEELQELETLREEKRARIQRERAEAALKEAGVPAAQEGQKQRGKAFAAPRRAQHAAQDQQDPDDPAQPPALVQPRLPRQVSQPQQRPGGQLAQVKAQQLPQADGQVPIAGQGIIHRQRHRRQADPGQKSARLPELLHLLGKHPEGVRQDHFLAQAPDQPPQALRAARDGVFPVQQLLF